MALHVADSSAFREPTIDWFGDGESSPSSRPTSAATSFFSTLESLPGESADDTPASTPRMPFEHRPPTAGSDQPSSSVLPELIGSLGSFHDNEKGEAAIQLALLIDTSTSEDMATIGHRLRTLGGIERLVLLLEHGDAAIHQSALLIVGNLCTDTVDPNAEATKVRPSPHAARGRAARRGRRAPCDPLGCTPPPPIPPQTPPHCLTPRPPFRGPRLG